MTPPPPNPPSVHFEKTEIVLLLWESENAKSISWNCRNLIYWLHCWQITFFSSTQFEENLENQKINTSKRYKNLQNTKNLQNAIPLDVRKSGSH